MLLTYAEEATKKDRDYILYNLDVILDNILSSMSIAQIDKYSRSKIKQAVFENTHCKKGEWDTSLIESIVKNEIHNIEHLHGITIKRPGKRAATF